MLGSSCHPLILSTVTAVTFWCMKNHVGHSTKPQSYVSAQNTRIRAKFELVERAHKRVFGLRVLQHSLGHFVRGEERGKYFS